MADVSNTTTAPEMPLPAAEVSILDRWSAEFNAAYLAYHEEEAAISRTSGNEVQLNNHLDRRDDAVWGLIRAPTPYKWMLVEKLQLLLRLMEEDWTDGRDLVLAASILRDVQHLKIDVQS